MLTEYVSNTVYRVKMYKILEDDIVMLMDMERALNYI